MKNMTQLLITALKLKKYYSHKNAKRKWNKFLLMSKNSIKLTKFSHY